MDKQYTEFGLVFRSVICNSDISFPARTLYSILCTYRDKGTNACFPGTDILCKATGSNRQRVNDWLLELEKAKAICRHTRFNTLTGRKIRTIVITDNSNE